MSKIAFDKFTRIVNGLSLEGKTYVYNVFSLKNNIELFLCPMRDFIEWTRRFSSDNIIEKLNFVNFNSKHNYYMCDKDYNVKSVSYNEVLDLVNKNLNKIFEDEEVMRYLNDYLEDYI